MRCCGAFYIPPDGYISSDAVFGVKSSLVVPKTKVTADLVEKYIVPEGTAMIACDFVLVRDEDTAKLRDKLATESMTRLFPGKKVELVNHLPVPELD